MRLLVTRPQPDAARTASALAARGHDAAVAPLLCMEAVDFELPEQAYAAVVMTSANAARAISRHPRGGQLMPLPVFAVGRQTAEAARNVGFGAVHAAPGDKRRLSELIRSCVPAGGPPLIYLAGENRAGDLDLGGLLVVTAVVYRAVKATSFPDAVASLLAKGAIDGVLHFSGRTAEAYLDCGKKAGIAEKALAPRHFCFSSEVAEPLLLAGAARVHVAPRPEEAALLDLIDTYRGP